ncbi:MAG: transglutaminase-like cysteine peptidase [Gammaproteobacteria bacterium]|nr:transglutaminase-like cysteine peptidase [Gammaproteobacteria bacterium]MBU1656042.1 transglutaminase-like cysteine peptidase [Gammaproteobacteria bacterium]MBU1960283.1 transglutaminase-like cysteine peptidase [Gammaproteobacteria bacterium]
MLSTFSSGLGSTESAGVLLSPDEIQGAGARYGEEALKRVNTWQRLIRGGLGKEEREKLELVNNFFNQIRYRSDQQHWGQVDYWATPLEALGTNGADCEDYAIAKYLTLIQLGVPDERLRITYVKALTLNQAHMVLTYYETPDAEPLVLDNLNKQVLGAETRKDLLPIYSFNGSGLWVSKGRASSQSAGSSARLSRWQDVKSKLKSGR